MASTTAAISCAEALALELKLVRMVSTMMKPYRSAKYPSDSWLVTDADQVDRVQAQSPAAGTWLQPGEVVTVRLGVLADSGGGG